MDLAASGRNWAIATPHALASRAGARAFERGGNAIDAALAAATTLAVVYPHMCGVGGDLFAVVHRPEGDTRAVNSSGRAPLAADPDALRAAHGSAMPLRGPDSITVPGAPAGWAALHRIGAALPWSEAFDDARVSAHDGVPLARDVASSLVEGEGAEVLVDDPALAGVFAPNGRPLAEGEELRQPALGTTLDTLAAGGAEALYRGPVGAAYVRGLRAAGSRITESDLAGHEAYMAPPLVGAFAGGDIHLAVAPPNSQGYSLLQSLAAIDRLGIDPDPHGPDAATLARIFLEGLRDVRRHLADPERMAVHPSTLLEDGYLAAFCDAVRAPLVPGDAPARPSGDTIALVAMDAEGTAVSLVQSLFWAFGSGILDPSTGIVAHNRGACFTLAPGLPNTYTPGALPLHTLLPVLLLDQDRGLVGAAGTKGSFQQPQIDAQVIVHAFVRGRTPADAVAAPRWIVEDLPDDGLPPIVAETDLPAPTIDALGGSGLAVQEVAARPSWVGHAHLVRRIGEEIHAGTDPRADGAALAG
ncbi:MAG TPA: gamma-glutamyltransferase [Actinomycetota bacterium]